MIMGLGSPESKQTPENLRLPPKKGGLSVVVGREPNWIGGEEIGETGTTAGGVVGEIAGETGGVTGEAVEGKMGEEARKASEGLT